MSIQILNRQTGLRIALLTSTALTAMATLVPLSQLANAAGGNGGAPVTLTGGLGGDGGNGPNGGSGGNGTPSSTNNFGGGGGGGGAGGGVGGNGAQVNSGTAGTGGQTAGANGNDGTPRSGAGGGAGGSNGSSLNSPVGGNGGNGGSVTGGTAGGGGGGEGGYGYVADSGLGVSFGNNVIGGNGGNGGTGRRGGNGGDGGVGIFVVNSPYSVELQGSFTVTGGNGGARGANNDGDPQSNGSTGQGGAGIRGGSLTINLGSGSVIGGMNGDNTVRAAAIDFTAGTNAINFGTAASGLTGGIGIATGATAQLNAAAGGTTVSNIISGGGGLIHNSANTLTLSGANTYTGATTISAGALNIQNATALGTTAAGTSVAAGAALQLQNNFTTGEALTLNGTGVANDGALRSISGNNGVTGAITLGSATRINTDGAGMVLSGGISGAGQNVTFGGAGLTTVSGAIATGTGTVTKDGSGGLVLQGNNSYTGLTTINAGNLFLVSGMAIADTGAVVVNTTGTVTVGFSETIGSIVGAGNVVLNNTNAALTTGGDSSSTTLSGVVSGSGRLVKAGTGTFTLSGASTYTGTTTVNAGTLAVNGSIATSSLTTVNAGGTLGGSGTVGNTTISGGVLAPGNSIGTLTVQGNLVLNAAAAYMVEVSPTNADRTNVTGTATLGGAAVNATFAAGSYIARQYTILNAAGGRSGTFGTLTNTGLPSGFTSSLSYDANNVYLNLALVFAGPAFPGGLNGNQQAVANGLTNSFNANGGIPGAYGSLTSQGLSQGAGEVLTGAQTSAFTAASTVLGLLTDPPTTAPRDATGAPVAFAADEDAMAYARRPAEQTPFARIFTKAPPRTVVEPRWNVWAAGFGGTQRTDGNAVVGSATTTSRLYGAAVGADYRISPDTKLGFALAGGGTNFALAGGLGSGRSDLFQAGVYGRHQFGAGYVTGALAYGWQDVTTNRFAVTDQLRARFDTNTISARIESGWRFATPWMGVTPYAAGQAIRVSLPSYAETVLLGPGAFALAFAARDASTTRSELGLRTDKSFIMGDALLTLRGRAAWAHDFDRNRIANATFVALPLASFTVNGARPAADAALVTASAETNWRNGWSTSVTFEGEFSNVTRSYAGKGAVKYAW